MPNIRLIVEYDGSRFHGWQKQPGVRTIQEELERVIRMVLREQIPFVAASGRTDAGVHARGQVVNFNCSSVPDLHRLKHAISSLMKGELSVIEASVAPDDFHSCRSTKQKQYTYTILHRDSPAVLDKGHAWHVGGSLDIERMIKEAALLVGQHDFTSFRAANCGGLSPIKRILESEVTFEPPYLRYRVVGEGFLKQMVRIIVGTLVTMGRGEMERTVTEILAARDRTQAGVTAPAYALCLDWVEY